MGMGTIISSRICRKHDGGRNHAQHRNLRISRTGASFSQGKVARKRKKGLSGPRHLQVSIQWVVWLWIEPHRHSSGFWLATGNFSMMSVNVNPQNRILRGRTLRQASPPSVRRRFCDRSERSRNGSLNHAVWLRHLASSSTTQLSGKAAALGHRAMAR